MSVSSSKNPTSQTLNPVPRGLLRTADILLTASNTANSRIIQRLTCAPVSHALVMVDPIRAMDAMPGAGVKERRLENVVLTNGLVLVLRHRSISFRQSALVGSFVQSQIGKQYDYSGAARSAATTGCKAVGKLPFGHKIQILDEYGKLSDENHDKTFFCSELIVRAFEVAGAPLSPHRARNASPGAILRADSLCILGRLL